MPLRTQITEIKKAIVNGTATDEGRMTVGELVERYVAKKDGTVKNSTIVLYGNIKNKILSHRNFSQIKINKVCADDCETFLDSLKNEDGMAYASIRLVRTVLTASFKYALRNDWIAKNPVNFSMKEAIGEDDSEKVEAITPEEKTAFLTFCKSDKIAAKYYDVMVVLFGTAMRISEFCGLIDSDIDFDSGVIHITRQLKRTKGRLNITTPKSKTSVRTIPFDEEVEAALKRIISERDEQDARYKVDGVSGFLTFTRGGAPKVAVNWDANFRIARNRFKAQTGQEVKIKPHVCRHTCITELANEGMIIPLLSGFAGHSNVTITDGRYITKTADSIANEFRRVKEKS